MGATGTADLPRPATGERDRVAMYFRLQTCWARRELSGDALAADGGQRTASQRPREAQTTKSVHQVDYGTTRVKGLAHAPVRGLDSTAFRHGLRAIRWSPSRTQRATNATPAAPTASSPPATLAAHAEAAASATLVDEGSIRPWCHMSSPAATNRRTSSCFHSDLTHGSTGVGMAIPELHQLVCDHARLARAGYAGS